MGGDAMIEYLTVAEARDLPGLRLALTIGVPGPWSMSARAVLAYRNVPFVPVAQRGMEANEDLVLWTGRRNAPVAVYDDEAPVDGWLEITNLAERLGGGPSLFPDDPVDRALAVGLSAEICGHGGFGWSKRLALGDRANKAGSEMTPVDRIMGTEYGRRPGTAPAARRRMIGILDGLTGQLKSQLAMGRHYLVGDRPSCCDIHWACFSQMVAPLPHEDCPMPDYVRNAYTVNDDEILAALDPILIAHRDMIFRDHIGLPLDM